MPASAWAACGAWSGAGTQSDPYTATASALTPAEVSACVSAVTTSQSGYVQIVIPADTQTWASGVSIDLTSAGFANVTRFTLLGAGATTAITDGIAGTTTPLFTIKTKPASETDDYVRVSGISIDSTGQSRTLSNGAIYIYNGSKHVRVDRVTVNLDGYPQGRGVLIGSYSDATPTFGVVDSCTFTKTTGTGTHNGVSVYGNGDYTWNNIETGYGSENFVFIENCTFSFNSYGDGAYDSYNGARVIFRYNTVAGTTVGSHGYDSGGLRSPQVAEIYNNSFSNSGSNISTGFRGGTGLYYNNTQTGNWREFVRLKNYRSCAYFEGTHTGANGASVLEDSNITTTCAEAGFDADTHVPPYCSNSKPVVDGSHYIYNLSDHNGDDTAVAKCKVTSHTATTITCTLAGGTRNSWNNGDHYAVLYYSCKTGACGGYSPLDGNTVGGEGYSCRDQIGRTKDQALAPWYFWGNNYKGDTSPTVVVPNSASSGCPRQVSHITENRDYYNNTTYAYAPYTCPHPLTALTGSCTSTAGTGGYNLGNRATIGAGAACSIGSGAVATIY
jgi:hypothetical protein